MVELVVPKVGESITEVQVAQWLKGEGESVDRDANVAVLETDKATVELPSPVSGKIGKLLKKAGDMAKVGEVIGYVEEGPAAAKPASAAPASKAPAAEAKPAPLAPAAPVGNAQATVMPAARRALAENNLQPSDVQATGPGGRMLKEDVQRRAEAGPAAQAATPAAAPVAGARMEETVPMSMLRRKVAERLVQAQSNAALLTTFNEIDMSGVMALRAQHQEAFQKKYGIKLGFMSFFIKAAVDALKLIPQINAEVRDNAIVYKHYYDIGVAVGGGKGLVVPVIRNAELLGFAELEKAIADLAKRAGDNSIKLEELQGGTFTISNGGTYGSLLSTPIVNPPQSGVLGMHAIQDRPVARNGQVVIRPMMYVALTYDHRIVDGREAVTFLKRIKEAVEDPARILLEV
jgi:2-oxoglutarate dehydrogenase E2 component (dihydrolipoamide succinyltransferase)